MTAEGTQPAVRLDVTVEHIDQVAVVIACGEVDRTTAAVLEDDIEAALSVSPAAVIVDLSEVGFWPRWE